ncbi:citrulline utilization hydrolase CtlX [Flavitalea sp.]|nr:arginine deiminase-related protein [Flavitalea sp.]
MQTTSNILMIRPVNFSFNAETAVNNAFQVAGNDEDAQQLAILEFENFVDLLKEEDVDVTVVNDSAHPFTPDSIFPNNWISFHQDGTVCLYPMYAANRRLERKPAVLEKLAEKFLITDKIDLSGYENQNCFLEGTGSMVLDRDNNIAYACLSPRTDIKVLEKFCALMKYRPVIFSATDLSGQAIYHTNVMMCVGEQFVVIALASIKDPREKEHVLQVIQQTGKEVIDITMQQMKKFAGNMLELNNRRDEKLLVMSTMAFGSLTEAQIQKLNTWCRMIHSPLNTIETNGGGSARCMIAEIHLPPRSSFISTSASSKEIGS